jgi:hypothetical protein
MADGYFKLGDERIEMMDAKSYNYADLKLPCSSEVKTAFEGADVKTLRIKGFEGNGVTR